MHTERHLKILFLTLSALGCLVALIAAQWDPRYVLLGAILFAIFSYIIIERVFIFREGGKASYTARRHAEALHDEIQRILRRYSQRLKSEQRQALEGSSRQLTEALSQKDLEKIRRTAKEAASLLKESFAFTKKSTFREYVESIGGMVLLALTLRAFIIEPFQIPSGSMIPTLQVGDYIFVSKSHYGLKVPLTNYMLYEFRKPARGDIVVFVHPNPAPNEEIKDLIKRVVAVEGDEVSISNNVLTITTKEGKTQKISLAPEGEYSYCDHNGYPDQLSPECPHDRPYWETKNIFQEDLFGVKHKVLYNQQKERATLDPCPLSRGTECWRRYDGPSERRRWPEEFAISPAQKGKPFKIPEGYVFVMGDNRDDSDDSRAWGPVPISHIKGKALFIWLAGKPFQWPPQINADRLFLRIE